MPWASTLEAITKTATVVSVLLIVLLQLGVNLDITWKLRALTAVAILVGWTLPTVTPRWAAALWLFVAPLAPAIIGHLTHREGPVVDLVWISGLAATLIRMTSWSRWELPGGWRPLIGGWALTLSLAWPVIALREIGFDPRIALDTGAVNSWAMLSAPHVFAWILYVALTQLVGALWLDDVAARVVSDSRELRRVVTALVGGVTVASLVAVYQGLFDLGFLSTTEWALRHRATGTMMDANAYGVLAAVAGPLAFVALRLYGRERYATAAGVAMLAINSAGMWMSGSRTALLCGAGGLAGLVAAVVLLHRGTVRRVLPPLVAATVVAAVVGATTSSAIGPLQRLHELPQNAGSAIWSLWTRGGYGTVAIDMVREYPLTGVGVGTYHVIAPDYWRLHVNDALPFDNAQNWWRHQVAELGLLGAAPIILWSVLVAWVVLFRRLRTDRRFAAITLRGVVVGVAAYSMLGMPTQSPLVLLAFLLALGWLSAALIEPELPLVRASAAAWVLVTALAVSYAAAHLWLGHQSLSVASRAVRFGREYVVGAYAPESTPAADEFRWTGKQATFMWPVQPGVLVLHLWGAHPDLGRSPVQVSVATPCGEVFEGTLPDASNPVELALQIPEGQRTVAATVRVSRTWQPSQVIRGSTDWRTLGAAVSEDWVSPDDVTAVPMRPLPACSAGS